jgi:hypothetical protein
MASRGRRSAQGRRQPIRLPIAMMPTSMSKISSKFDMINSSAERRKT